MVRFTTLPNHTVNKDLAVLILTEYRYSVWNCRCKVQIENKNPLAKSVLELLLARLNNRLILDFNRFNIIQFTNFWISTGLARINRNGRTVSLLRVNNDV